STDRPSVSTDRPFVSTDRSHIPYVNVASTSTNDGIFNRAYDDDEDVGAVVDFNNMDNTIAVSPIPTLRIHNNHPKGQILGDPTSTVQTRWKIQKASSVQQALILVDLPFGKKAIGTKWVFRTKKDERSIVVKKEAILLAQGHRQEEGIDYDEVFAPVARIEAIRLFLAIASYKGFIVYQMDVKSTFLYGTIQEEVYVHQPPGFIDPAHPNKVYKVVKALYGLHQAPRAWYETLSSFLLENDFRRGTIDKTLFIKKNQSDIMLVQVYVDDIIFGCTKKSMCTEFEEVMHKRFQMSSMGELTFFLGLQVKQQPDGIFISQYKYVADILKKFDLCSIKTTTTPIESNKPLVKDEDGVEVDIHEYRSMIGSLIYLIASRPDIMFAVCACERFQVTPKASHLHAVKRIFRYLKHQPKLGLWYHRDSPFELEAFPDSDYAGASLDRKSTTGGCQFLGRRLIYWQCKKQKIMANSTTEVEYVAAAHCCGQVLWIQNEMIDYGFNFMNTKIHIDNENTICVVKNPVYHSRTKHIEIRHYFIRDCYEKRLIDVLKIHTDSNVADLLTKGFDVTRISMDLRMDRSNPGKYNSSMVFHMANLKYSDKHNMVAFLKKPNESVGFTEVVDFLKGTSLRYALTHNPTIYDSLVKQFWQIAIVRTLANGTQQLVASIDSKEYTITEESIRRDIVPLLPAMLAGAAVDQGEGSAQPAEPHHTPVDPIPSTSQLPHSPHPSPQPHSPLHQSPPHSPLHHSPYQSPPHSPHHSPPHFSPPRSYEAPLPEGNTSGSAEDSVQLKELMVLVPKLVTRINSLEKELKDTKQTLGNVVLKLVKKVKTLETALKRKSKKVLISESEGEESEEQGRKFRDIDDDPLVSLVQESMKEKSTDFVTPTKALGEAHEEEISPTILEATKTLSKVASQGVSKEKSTDKGKRYRRRARSMAKKIDTGLDAEEEIDTGREEINTGIEEVSTGSTKVDSGIASKRGQREGKAPMVEEDIQVTHKTKEQLRQEEAGLAKLEANAELSKDVLGQDLPEYDFAKRMVDMVNQRKKHFAEERAKAKRNKPMTQSHYKGKIEKIWRRASDKDFTREDLIELYRLVMQKYGTNRPEDAYDRVLWSDLRTMFDPPLIEDAIWSLPLQQKMVSWRYYDKCEVHCLTLEACTIYMLADRKYPLSKEACQVMLKMKLLDGKMNEVCYKLLKMIEKQAGIRK
ncbi:putative ribonuclease H-like domain-containing protein, partial [Tanacetum coccineum]